MSKICVLCKIDVSNMKRTKDPQGNYYCEPCWNQARMRAAGASAASPKKSPPPLAPVAASSGPPPLREDADLDLAPPVPAASGGLDFAQEFQQQVSAPPAAQTHAALFNISQDSGPFFKLGSSFKLAKNFYLGVAAASPKAIYLVKVARQQKNYGHGGGLIGGIAGSLIDAATAIDDKLSTCHVGDLPAATRQFLDPKGKQAGTDVVVISADTVNYVKAGSFNNTIKITVGKENFLVTTGIFSIGKCKRKLAEMGWQLNTQLTPTAAPVHNLGLSAGPEKPETPAWQKALMIVGAVILIIGAIALKVWLKSNR